MIRLTATLFRNPELTHQEFLEHWMGSHGPLIASLPNLSKHIVRYEQHPRAGDGPLFGTEGCDGVTVQWFESEAGFLGFLSEPDYQTYIAPDEKVFLDMNRVQFVLTSEPTVVFGSAL
ncbi:MAG TPA: hypothetical protein DEG43_11170 [Acidimicrobiaceae bacterium]|nr:hypothetical protein [Acidimicrobiaceae bacterium]